VLLGVVVVRTGGVGFGVGVTVFFVEVVVVVTGDRALLDFFEMLVGDFGEFDHGDGFWCYEVRVFATMRCCVRWGGGGCCTADGER